MYQKQWISKQNFIYDDLLTDQVDILMKQWKTTNEYSKRINTQTMHDESSYKHLQNIKRSTTFQNLERRIDIIPMGLI